MELAIELSSQGHNEKSILDTDVTPEDDAELIGQKLQNTINSVLSETLNLLSFETLETVAEQIRSSRAVYFFWCRLIRHYCRRC